MFSGWGVDEGTSLILCIIHPWLLGYSELKLCSLIKFSWIFYLLDSDPFGFSPYWEPGDSNSTKPWLCRLLLLICSWCILAIVQTAVNNNSNNSCTKEHAIQRPGHPEKISSFGIGWLTGRTPVGLISVCLQSVVFKEPPHLKRCELLFHSVPQHGNDYSVMYSTFSTFVFVILRCYYWWICSFLHSMNRYVSGTFMEHELQCVSAGNSLSRRGGLRQARDVLV